MNQWMNKWMNEWMNVKHSSPFIGVIFTSKYIFLFRNDSDLILRHNGTTAICKQWQIKILQRQLTFNDIFLLRWFHGVKIWSSSECDFRFFYSLRTKLTSRVMCVDTKKKQWVWWRSSGDISLHIFRENISAISSNGKWNSFTWHNSVTRRAETDHNCLD